jgi:hypothetical protein
MAGNLGLPWTCTSQLMALSPRCLQWDTQAVMEVCGARTDGFYYYGALSNRRTSNAITIVSTALSVSGVI